MLSCSFVNRNTWYLSHGYIVLGEKKALTDQIDQHKTGHDARLLVVGRFTG